MSCKTGYFNTAHTACASKFWFHLQVHLCSCYMGWLGQEKKKFIPVHDILEGGSCGAVSNLHFAVNSDSCHSVSWAQGALLRQLECLRGQSGFYQFCYHFTWTGCPSLLGCVDTDYMNLLQYLLPVHRVVKRTMKFSYNVWIKSQGSLWYCSPKRPEKLYLVDALIISLSPVRTW